MATAMFMDTLVTLSCAAEYPTARGVIKANGLMLVERQLLATDPAGITTVTFSGVNAGSEIRVYLPDTTEAAGIETCSTDQVLVWPVYSAGSPNNTVRIVIIHPDYKIKEFNYTSSVGTQSLPIQQERDKWYSNPV